MNILIVSTLKRRVDPDNFASRSRIIYQLSAGLVRRGHKVSLLGTSDSQIPGVEIIPVLEKGWVDLPAPENEFSRDVASLIKQSYMIAQLQGDFDIIHNHTYPDFSPVTIEKELRIPMVTTLHALYTDYIDELLSIYNKTYLVALSNAYKNLFKKAKIFDVVYNGVDTNLYKFNKDKDDYLLWIGRLARGKKDNGDYIDQKGVRWAIQLARETNSRLSLAGPCEDKKFFDKDVAPYLNGRIQWVGEVSPEQSVPVDKIVSLMQHTKAFLMTINQEEPFGLVMAEAMSCGAPVIGFDRGSVSEVVDDGKTGFIVAPSEGIDGLKKALSKISNINPSDCKDRVDKMFSVEKMIDNYEKVYGEVVKK